MYKVACAIFLFFLILFILSIIFKKKSIPDISIKAEEMCINNHKYYRINNFIYNNYVIKLTNRGIPVQCTGEK